MRLAILLILLILITGCTTIEQETTTTTTTTITKESWVDSCTKEIISSDYECEPYCGAIGSKSEGWYDCTGRLIKWANCEECGVIWASPSGEITTTTIEQEFCEEKLTRRYYKEDGSYEEICLEPEELGLKRCSNDEDCSEIEECKQGFCELVYSLVIDETT